MGGIVAFIDAEHALDPVYAARLGVDIDEVLISQPDTGEQALEICDMLVRSGAIDAIVVDSVAALVPRAEIEGEIGDTTVACRRASCPSPAQTGRFALEIEYHLHLHQPATREDRRNVRQPGNDNRRSRAQVLLRVCASTSAVSTPSRTAARSWGNRVRAKVVQEQSAPRRFAKLSSTSCTARAFERRLHRSIWPLKPA